jgi:hemerythrin-like metal-binding protein
MLAFGWDPRYETGIASIDAQHRVLLQSARELHEAYRSGSAKEVVPRVLDNLVTYCMTHFEDEEVHMERLAFPELSAHREEHQKLMAQVYDLQDRFTRGEGHVPMELSILVTRWMRKHIQEHDQAFADFARGQGLENS